METISSRLAALRTLAGLKATELGDLAGLSSPAHVGMIERGDRPNISAMTAVALARTLGTSAEYLVEGTGEPPTHAEVLAAVARARTPSAPTPAAGGATTTALDGTPGSHVAA